MILPFTLRALDKQYRTLTARDGAHLAGWRSPDDRVCGDLPVSCLPDRLKHGRRDRRSDYAAYLNYLHFGEATLTFPQTLVLQYGHFGTQERRLSQVADDYARWFLARFHALEPLRTHFNTQPIPTRSELLRMLR